MHRLASLASVLGLASAVSACGSVSPGADANPHPIDGASLDAAAACNPTAPFGTLQPIAAVNTDAWEARGVLSADRRTLYFSTNRGTGGAWSVDYATRSDVNAAFGAPAVLPGIPDAGHSQLSPTISGDDLTLLFTELPAITGQADIYLATRSTPASQFGAPEVLANVNDPSANEDATYLDPTGTVLYLESDRGGDLDIYRATRASTSDAFGTPTPVGELNSTSTDGGAVLTADGLTVYFNSSRPGGAGCTDVMTATRSSLQDGFGTPVAVPELSTADCDVLTWISPDGCQAVVSVANTTTFAPDLFLASRP